MNCQCVCHKPSIYNGNGYDQSVKNFVSDSQRLAQSILNPSRSSSSRNGSGFVYAPTTYNIGNSYNSHNNYGGVRHIPGNSGINNGDRIAVGILATIIGGFAAFWLGQQNTQHEEETMRLDDINSFKSRHFPAKDPNHPKMNELREIVDLSKKITKGRRDEIGTSRALTIGVLAAAALMGVGAVANAPGVVIAGLCGLGVAFVVKMYLWGSKSDRAERNAAHKINEAAQRFLVDQRPVPYRTEHCQGCDRSGYMHQ